MNHLPGFTAAASLFGPPTPYARHLPPGEIAVPYIPSVVIRDLLCYFAWQRCRANCGNAPSTGTLYCILACSNAYSACLNSGAS